MMIVDVIVVVASEISLGIDGGIDEAKKEKEMTMCITVRSKSHIYTLCTSCIENTNSSNPL